jgi:DNA-binding protein Fis
VAFILHDIEDPLVRRIGAYIADGYTQRETAELMGMTESAVRSKLERFRNDHHE